MWPASSIAFHWHLLFPSDKCCRPVYWRRSPPQSDEHTICTISASTENEGGRAGDGVEMEDVEGEDGSVRCLPMRTIVRAHSSLHAAVWPHIGRCPRSRRAYLPRRASHASRRALSLALAAALGSGMSLPAPPDRHGVPWSLFLTSSMLLNHAPLASSLYIASASSPFSLDTSSTSTPTYLECYGLAGISRSLERES